MPITFNITGATVEEAAQLAHDLHYALTKVNVQQVPIDTTVTTVDTDVSAPAAPVTTKTATAVKVENPPQQVVTSTSEPVPDIVELRAKAQQIGKTVGAKQAIKALLTQYGCKSISDVPAAKRSAFLQDLDGIAS